MKVSKLPLLQRRRRPSTAITEIERKENSTKRKANLPCLYIKVSIFHYTFFVITPTSDYPERSCCEQTDRTYRLEKTPEKLPIQQIELTLAPITLSHHGVVVITRAKHVQGPQFKPTW